MKGKVDDNFPSCESTHSFSRFLQGRESSEYSRPSKLTMKHRHEKGGTTRSTFKDAGMHMVREKVSVMFLCYHFSGGSKYQKSTVQVQKKANQWRFARGRQVTEVLSLECFLHDSELQ